MTAQRGKILFVDDDPIVLDSLAHLMRAEGYDVDTAASFDRTMQTLTRQSCDLLITDINMPDGDGFELLRAVKSRHSNLVVIIMTGYGTIESAVEAIKMGAYDYLTKPINDDEILLAVRRAMEQSALLRECQSLRERLDDRFGLDSVIGHDYKMLRVFDLIQAVSDSAANVLIDGDSGTGKSMIARVIHHRSDRRDKPFVEVSCGAIPESLLESELFGHARGAFTGAVSDKAGKFKAADGGTLFLDEIAAASPALQVKLLRIIQERQFEPVGSNKTEKVDVRLVFATNLDLEREAIGGRFRQDLYYRINVVTVSLPTLADRIGDIPLLSERFLGEFASKSKKRILGITDEAIEHLQRYSWPGNVRELENVMERAVVLARGPNIGVEDLPAKLVQCATDPRTKAAGYLPSTLKDALEVPERRIIEEALRHNNWCRQSTAAQLDINRTTLYKKMKRYGLENDPLARRTTQTPSPSLRDPLPKRRAAASH